MKASARGTRKGARADHTEERDLLDLLTHGLSEDEIRRVVACALLALDERVAGSPRRRRGGGRGSGRGWSPGLLAYQPW